MQGSSFRWPDLQMALIGTAWPASAKVLRQGNCVMLEKDGHLLERNEGVWRRNLKGGQTEGAGSCRTNPKLQG